MTFKDKEKEIEYFVEDYGDYKEFTDLYLSRISELSVICDINGNEALFYEDCDHIRFRPKNGKETYSKSEIKFIYNFIEFLESLGFKEGE